MDNITIKLSPKLAKQAELLDDKNQQYIMDMLKNLEKRMAEEKSAKPQPSTSPTAQR